MITAISGAASTPFTVAAQKRALTGSMCKKIQRQPIRLALRPQSDNAHRRSFGALARNLPDRGARQVRRQAHSVRFNQAALLYASERCCFTILV
jgi:multidrug resistance efflux pump